MHGACAALASALQLLAPLLASCHLHAVVVMRLQKCVEQSSASWCSTTAILCC